MNDRNRHEPRQPGSSRNLAYERDYDRDRHGYARSTHTDRDDGRGWRGPGPTYDPALDRDGMSTRDYGYGYEPRVSYETDTRDGWQRLGSREETETEHGAHARVWGERGFGPQYRGHDGRGASQDRALTGRGPNGYVRSDERMKEEICERLASQPHDWSELEVHVSDGEVTLTGSVWSRELKYEAERVADSVRGVKDVTNQLRVRTDTLPRLGSSSRGHET